MKSLYLIIMLSLIYLCIGTKTDEKIIIPKESLRFRVVANSNNEYDQLIKIKVKENVNKLISEYIVNASDLFEVEKIIKDNLEEINENIGNTLKKENYLKGYNITMGKNYFPKKELYGILYEEGEYESLVITLGKGLGENWWCVLFPPLCLIEAEDSEKVEYRLYVKDVLEKYFFA